MAEADAALREEAAVRLAVSNGSPPPPRGRLRVPDVGEQRGSAGGRPCIRAAAVPPGGDRTPPPARCWASPELGCGRQVPRGAASGARRRCRKTQRTRRGRRSGARRRAAARSKVPPPPPTAPHRPTWCRLAAPA
jgi:hypothetical protein